MMKDEQAYLDLMKVILSETEIDDDRTGVGTKSIFGPKLEFSLENNTLPLLTTKKMFTRGIIEELLFFIRGHTNSKLLEAKGINIWKGNTSREFLDKRGLNYPEGEMGPMYGALWRNFSGVDQLSNALNLIKTNPSSRRIMVTAYDPSKSKECVLDCCHTFYQFYIKNGKLDCQWYQRSVDYCAGLGFNIASYAILTHLMAKASGLKPGKLIFSGGNTHIYKTHFENAEIQSNRKPSDFPTLNIKKDISSIQDMENLCFEDFEVINYNCQGALKYEMAV